MDQIICLNAIYLLYCHMKHVFYYILFMYTICSEINTMISHSISESIVLKPEFACTVVK